MFQNGAELCSYCAMVIAAKAFKAVKGKVSCGAQWIAVGGFSETKKIQCPIRDMGHLECLLLLNKTSENLGDVLEIIEATSTKI